MESKQSISSNSNSNNISNNISNANSIVTINKKPCDLIASVQVYGNALEIKNNDPYSIENNTTRKYTSNSSNQPSVNDSNNQPTLLTGNSLNNENNINTNNNYNMNINNNNTNNNNNINNTRQANYFKLLNKSNLSSTGFKRQQIQQHESQLDKFTKTELLYMLCHLEGELQARDIVIAALRNERVKNVIYNLKEQQKIQHNDPRVALYQDKVISQGNFISISTSINVIQADLELKTIVEQQMENLKQVIQKQRATHSTMIKNISESFEQNQYLRQLLEDEKRKHEYDTAQGDDITYGLEMERTKLKLNLKKEHDKYEKLDMEMKKSQDGIEQEKKRQKQIILYLLAEQEKIAMKYNEERKRSADLAQILSEEKQRSDSIADGLEEESKKSLRMEAELEKQHALFEDERKAIAVNISKEKARIRELETELAQLKNLMQCQPQPSGSALHIPETSKQLNMEPLSIAPGTEAPSSIINVAKIVQPTATVSSVPVSAPTTGVAKFVNPPKLNSSYAALNASGSPVPGNTIGSTKQVSSSRKVTQQTPNSGQNLDTQQPLNSCAAFDLMHAINSTCTSSNNIIPQNLQANRLPQQIVATTTTQATGFSMNNSSSSNSISQSAIAIGQTRGQPPPIPPNKPVIPPKRKNFDNWNETN